MKRLLIIPILIVALLSCKTKNTLKLYQAASKKAPYDAIIVPGVPHNGKNWSDVMSIRVRWANYLYQKKLTKNIIFSGGAVYTPYMECKVMKEYAKAMGIPDSVIYLDSIAEHSTENVFYSYQVAKKNGFKKLALATDPYQTFMIRRFTKKFKRKTKTDLDIIPIVMDTMKTLKIKEPIVDLSLTKVDSFVSIEDSQSRWERFRGTLGKRVDWKEVVPPSQ